MKVLDYKKLEISKIRYKSPIKKNNHLYSNTYYFYNNQEIPIRIQTPKLKLISNIKSNNLSSFIELELDKEHINFFEFINNIDDNNIAITYNNSDLWFQNQLPMDIIDDYYIGQIKMKKYNKSPIIKFKIQIHKNDKGCKFFGENLLPIDPELVTKNTDVICILSLNGIKYYKQRFECDWNVIQLRAYTEPKLITSQCLINEDFFSDNEETPDIFNNIKNNSNYSNNEPENNIQIENNEPENNIQIENNEPENIYDYDDTEDELENEICKGLEEKMEEIEFQEDLSNDKNIEDLISEIEELKKINNEKNMELNKFKNKYENLN